MSLPEPIPTDDGASYHDWLTIRNANAALEQDIRDGLIEMVGQLQNAPDGDFGWAMECSTMLDELRA
jgi:hypothetical protein